MGLLSILLAALALICAGLGVLTSVMPGIGLIFAFGAPALALVGVMLGGSAMSKAKRAGQVNETARIGVILSALAFIPGLLVALTCGVCNAMFSSGDMRMQRDFRFGTGGPFSPDGGVRPLPPPQRAGGTRSQPDGPTEPEPAPPDPPPGGKPPTEPARGKPPEPPPAPPPPNPQGALPPPPLPPGPGR